jgi:hypothetical protein
LREQAAPPARLLTASPAPCAPSPAGTKADLDAFRKVASPEHTVVLANADLQGESMRAWSDAIAAGAVEWEGTLHESVDRPAGDSLLYGTFQPQRMDAVVPPV